MVEVAPARSQHRLLKGGSAGSSGSGTGSGGGSSSTGPEWVEGVFGDWTTDYIAQCENPRSSSEFDDVQGSIALENFWIRAYSFDTYLWYDEITDFNPNSDEDALNTELRTKGFLKVVSRIGPRLENTLS